MTDSEMRELMENYSDKLTLLRVLWVVLCVLILIWLIVSLVQRRERWKNDKPPRLLTVLKAYRAPRMDFGWDIVRGLRFVECTDKKREHIVVPEGVSVIGKNAFSGCGAYMKSVSLPESLRELEFGAFKDCTELTSVTIPAATRVIGLDIFNGCKSLAEVALPFTASLSVNMFRGCVSLRKLSVGGRGFEADGGDSFDRAMFLRIAAVLAADGDEAAIGYVTKNCFGVFKDIVISGDMVSFETLLESGILFPAEKIDEVIRLAIDKEKTEMYIMLVQYKRDRLGFSDDDIGGRFEL